MAFAALSTMATLPVVNALAGGAATAAPVSFFADTEHPTNAAAPDTSAVETGLRFQSTSTGTVTAIRYYRAPGSPGASTGHLWSGRGSLLATVSFADQGDSGWQQANLTTPVSLRVSSTYVVSYFSPKGGYSYSYSFFDKTGRASGPLSAPAQSNGVYCYSSRACLPQSSYRATNYWADLVFVPSNTTAGSQVTATTVASTTVAPTTTAAPATTTTAAPTTTTTAAPATTTTAAPTTTTTPTTAPAPAPPSGSFADGRDVATYSGTGMGIRVTPKIGPAAMGLATYTRDASGAARCTGTDLAVINNPGTLSPGTYDRKCFTGFDIKIPDGVTVTNSVFIVTGGDTSQACVNMIGTGSGAPAVLSNVEITSQTVPTSGSDPNCDRAIGVNGNGGWVIDRAWVHDSVRGIYFGTHGVNPNTWSSSATYAANDFVMYNDGSALSNTNDPTLAYISLVGGNVGHTPSSSPSQWRKATADDFMQFQQSRMRIIRDSMFGNFTVYLSGSHTSSVGHGNGAHSYYVAIQRTAMLNISGGAPSGMMQLYPELGGGSDGSAAYWLVEGNYWAGTNGQVGIQLGGTPPSEIDHHDFVIRNNFFGTLYNGTLCNAGNGGSPVSDSDSTFGSKLATLRNVWSNNVWYAPGTSKNGQQVSG